MTVSDVGVQGTGPENVLSQEVMMWLEMGWVTMTVSDVAVQGTGPENVLSQEMMMGLEIG